MKVFVLLVWFCSGDVCDVNGRIVDIKPTWTECQDAAATYSGQPDVSKTACKEHESRRAAGGGAWFDLEYPW